MIAGYYLTLIFDVYPAIIAVIYFSTTTLYPIDINRQLLLQSVSNYYFHCITNRRYKYV